MMRSFFSGTERLLLFSMAWIHMALTKEKLYNQQLFPYFTIYTKYALYRYKGRRM